MSLPPELIHNVASQFATSGTLPFFPRELKLQTGLNSRIWHPFKDLERRPVLVESQRSLLVLGSYGAAYTSLLIDFDTLLSLRLVSRSWNLAATDILKRHIWLEASLDSKERLQRSLDATSISATTGIPCSLGTRLLIPTVKHSLDITRYYKWKYEYSILAAEGEDASQPECEERPFCRWGAKPTIVEDTEMQYRNLKATFDNLQAVEALYVTFPRAMASTDFGKLADVDWYSMDAVTQSIAAIRYGLQSPACSSLVDLCLDLPCTYNVGELADALSQDARDRLRHLYISITDETGEFGSRSYSLYDRYDGDEDEIPQEEELIPSWNEKQSRSNLQYTYPNREHQGPIWQLVRTCPNLESLGISGSHFLDLDFLDKDEGPLSQRLCTLFLHRVYVSVSSLKALVQSGGEKPRLQRIFLRDVKMHADGGEWSDYFEFLLNECPALEFSGINQLTYFFAHPNHACNHRPTENYDYVWTRSRRDKKSLSNLRRHIRHKYVSSEDEKKFDSESEEGF